jgi:hypothetical protein
VQRARRQPGRGLLSILLQMPIWIALRVAASANRGMLALHG